MSFSMTERQLLDGSKTVTRRLGWVHLKPGDKLLAVRKAQGLKRGERQVVLGTITVVDVRREALDAITRDDCTREGYPDLSPAQFVDMFRTSFSRRLTSAQEITRIEFTFAPLPGAKPGVDVSATTPEGE